MTLTLHPAAGRESEPWWNVVKEPPAGACLFRACCMVPCVRLRGRVAVDEAEDDRSMDRSRIRDSGLVVCGAPTVPCSCTAHIHYIKYIHLHSSHIASPAAAARSGRASGDSRYTEHMTQNGELLLDPQPTPHPSCTAGLASPALGAALAGNKGNTRAETGEGDAREGRHPRYARGAATREVRATEKYRRRAESVAPETAGGA